MDQHGEGSEQSKDKNGKKQSGTLRIIHTWLREW
jgi:hypothetical protein